MLEELFIGFEKESSEVLGVDVVDVGKFFGHLGRISADVDSHLLQKVAVVLGSRCVGEEGVEPLVGRELDWGEMAVREFLGILSLVGVLPIRKRGLFIRVVGEFFYAKPDVFLLETFFGAVFG